MMGSAGDPSARDGNSGGPFTGAAAGSHNSPLPSPAVGAADLPVIRTALNRYRHGHIHMPDERQVRVRLSIH